MMSNRNTASLVEIRTRLKTPKINWPIIEKTYFSSAKSYLNIEIKIYRAHFTETAQKLFRIFGI